MRCWNTVSLLLVLLVLLHGILATAWSFTNILQSVQMLLNPEQETTRMLSYTGATNGNSSDEQDVSPLGRIIMVPRRKKESSCPPGEQLDRRGKCRKAW